MSRIFCEWKKPLCESFGFNWRPREY